MSKANEMIRYATQRGFTVDKVGQVYNPKGKPLKGYVRKKKTKQKGKGSGVRLEHTFGVCLEGNGYVTYPVKTHRFVAYMKYGEEAFKVECVRHLNDNSLDNSWDNIAIGTLYDNHLDAVRNGKSEPKKIKPPKPETLGERLSRNIDIAISLKAEGLTNQKVGELFGLSEHAVRRHIKAHS